MWAQTNAAATGLGQASFALAALAYAAYALHLWRGGLLNPPRDRAAWLLGLATSASVLWAVSGFIDGIAAKLLPWHLAVFFDHLRYAAWVWFMMTLLSGSRPLPALSRWGASLPAVLLVGGLACNLVLARTGVTPETLRALGALQLAWAVLALVLLEQVFRNQGESSRWAAKPLCLGLAAIFVYDVYLYAQAVMLGVPDPDVVDARGITHAMAVPLLVVAAHRNAHWVTGVRVSKGAAFYSAGLLLIGVYLLFVAGAGYYLKYFGGTWGGALQVALIAFAALLLAVLVLSGSQRARVRVMLNKHFFRYRYDYRVEWLRFTSMLASRSAPQELNLRVVRGLADLVESPAGSLWLRSSGTADYVPSACWNTAQLSASEPAESPFSTLIRDREWILELKDGVPAAETPEWMAQAGAVWLAIPLLVGDEMLGFVLLAPPRTPLDVNWEVRDLLKTAARQAAGFLALVQASEALIETRKFDAFNRMSAFVVHDLKNIVTQLALMLKNAERHRGNPEFQEDMLLTVSNSLEKMRQLMLQLREGERPEGVSSGVELVPILSRLQQAAARRGREVLLEIDERLFTRGHEQRLERVIGHTVQNALDATPPSGRVSIRLQRSAGRAMVTVADDGAGMNQEFIRTRLFRPFSSTKAHGMGIGLYESLQYLKGIGGGVEVESEEGRGTTVTLTMPLFDQASDVGLFVSGGHADVPS